MTRTFASATTLEDALDALGSGARPVAGGTDLVVGARQGKAALPEAIVAIDRIDTLGGSSRSTAACVSARWSRTTRSWPTARSASGSPPSPTPRRSSAHATRAHGTIGGNVMNASPAMDTGGPLLCFGASAEFRSASGERALPLEQLWTGPGETAADPRELLVRVDVPAPAPATGSAYVRLEYRRQMEIAVVGVTAVVRLDAGSVSDARVAITRSPPRSAESRRRRPRSPAPTVGMRRSPRPLAPRRPVPRRSPTSDRRPSTDRPWRT